jgi:DNA-binding transcriptional ArsR family regulator
MVKHPRRPIPARSSPGPARGSSGRSGAGTALDAVFAALADPTRRAIVTRLARGEASVTDLAGPFDMSLPAVTKHLAVLEGAGIVASEKSGRVRRCRLQGHPMREAAEWIAGYRRFWEERLDALDTYLQQAQKKEVTSWPNRSRKPTPPSGSAAPSRPRGRRSSGPGPRPRR